MDRNDSDADGSMSNQEEDDDIQGSEYEDDELGPPGSTANGGGGGAPLRLKVEAMDEVSSGDIVSRYKQQHLDDREDEEELVDTQFKVNEMWRHPEMLAAVQRHAVQAVAAAAAAQGVAMPHWASNVVGSSPPGGPLPLSLTAGGGPSANGGGHSGALAGAGLGLGVGLGASPGGLGGGGGGGGHGMMAAMPATTTTSLMSSSSPGGGSGSSGSGPTSTSSGTHLEAGKGYTFEEQFKQLYELSDDPKRKEFLDEIFSFMQKRGTPVNRIPIMAKQVLDLFELYRLVVARGGLVEVINKKIWREITKGLNLPSSITSAAFTLRTQYMKYLYPYECEKEKLSTPEELQAAIDGNRREGRRSSYGHYGDMSMVATPPPSGAANIGRNNHTPSTHQSHQSHPAHHTSAISLVSSRHVVNGHNNSHGASSGEEDNGSMHSSSHGHPGHNLQHFPAQEQALNLEVKGAMSAPNNNNNNNNNNNGNGRDPSSLHRDPDALGVTPAKRFMSEEERYLLNAGLPSAHIKINSRDGRSQIDNSLVVSMEINGLLYQGVLFPQTHKNRLS